MKQIVLIACVSQKGKTKAQAKDLYISQLFRNSLVYAYRLKPDKIFILSALHHLLNLDDEIEPYNVTLSSIPKNKIKPGLKILNSAERQGWGKRTLEQLAQVADLEHDNFVILAGQAYIKPLVHKLTHYEEPLKGLGQGKRLKFLKVNCASPAD